ncbi:SNF2-related protein [Bradyrhizobium sp. CB1717]|uniref:SNF2-related protein n=1 Tax=Bradyrhizobium sp. CB1717 TaxID=3039154 RepID=UPI0024B26FDB|nr:SNF2-related protein [Bradyrhizobium sp. CB1717]WFU25121.1 SNF2-related protein [Bradyrhizobium sp. CB1717]
MVAQGFVMVSWLGNRFRRGTGQLFIGFGEASIVVKRENSSLADGDGIAAHPLDPACIPLLEQLEDDAIAVSETDCWTIPWPCLYSALSRPEYSDVTNILGIPRRDEIAPILESSQSLADADFTIRITGWRDKEGRRLTDLKRQGGLVTYQGQTALLSYESWDLTRRVVEFAKRSAQDRNPDFHRQAWGEIRKRAMDAKAGLDAFLFGTVVLTPEKLDLKLRRSDIGGAKLVEVEPQFQEAPKGWIDQFDRLSSVPKRYDIPTDSGIVQVVITPAVRTVLQEIKQFPGRRVVGARAEAFLSNPFSALGDDAVKVLDPDQIEEAKAAAGIAFDHFIAKIERDPTGAPTCVSLVIESLIAGNPRSEIRDFASAEELSSFIGQARSRIAGGMQVFAWKGYEFELLGDTALQLDNLQQALDELQKPRWLVDHSSVYDLSNYYRRIEGIGVDKPYHSPFIAKKVEGEGWIPDNVVPLIAWTPDGANEPIAVPFTKELAERIGNQIEKARHDENAEIELKELGGSIKIADAEALLATFANVSSEIAAKSFDPDKAAKRDEKSGPKKVLLLRSNILTIDYEEVRRDLMQDAIVEPRLPRALKGSIELKQHQMDGLAWLQYRLSKAPDLCRGVILADDMGLGKTLQLLALALDALDRDSFLDPVLIVAPVALLENWKDELVKFFDVEPSILLMAYGSELARIRVPRERVDLKLQEEGLVKFLKPGWVGRSRIVLTTYETLRDLEFSFATQQWSIMVCDEAQKIKNPNALVTRAAKKQSAKFRIACTGTPVENSLADLWCLFDFVQPGLLGALNDFGQTYRRPIEAQTGEERQRIEELRAKVEPQILRRLKRDVARDLKLKVVDEGCRRLPISVHQRTLYSQAIDRFQNRSIDADGNPFRNHLTLLQYLRLVCTDPRKYGLNEFQAEPIKHYRAKSPKLDWLLRSLASIQKRKEKAIIFCEFRVIQRLLRHYIEEEFGLTADIINGDTTAAASHIASRQKRIKFFQEKTGFGVIILSPVAVGFGLNIQAANHVIHFTRTWNPAKEDQATDRAYRIGQEKDVYVYYPTIHADDFTTFEVQLDRLLTAKRSLADDMLNGAGDINPHDFDLNNLSPGDTRLHSDTSLTIDDVASMRPDYFECLIASLWQRRGFGYVYRTPASFDDGVDVVAIGSAGELVQCKSSTVPESRLGWDAIKDVVAGEASYRCRHPGVNFIRVCVTNSYFNDNAKRHAELNKVQLIDRDGLRTLLKEHPTSLLDVERLLFPTWQ